ncbi:MAG: glycosyltransferase, partial [Planctomycetota bacterium]
MKIALIGRDANRVMAFRGSLVRLAQREGHEVIAITGPAGGDEVLGLAQAGVKWFAAPLDAGGINPFADLRYRGTVERILRAERVEAVLAYNPKCLAHAPIAARRAGVRRVVGMVTGLGRGFIRKGPRERLVRLVKARLYRRAFATCDEVLIQNEHDISVLERCAALTDSVRARVRLIAGSGVDLDAFAPVPLPAGAHFLMISRPLREKGLPEFFEAARIAKRKVPSATFTWLGPMDDTNPSAIGRPTLERLLAAGAVQRHGECMDVR